LNGVLPPARGRVVFPSAAAPRGPRRFSTTITLPPRSYGKTPVFEGLCLT